MDAIDLLETVEEETGPIRAGPCSGCMASAPTATTSRRSCPSCAPDWPAIRFVFPHAPVRAVTINDGVRMRAWYDIRDLDLANRADEAGVRGVDRRRSDALIDREKRPRHSASNASSWRVSRRAARSRWRRDASAHDAARRYGRAVDLPADVARRRRRPVAAEARQQPVFLAHGDADPVIRSQVGAATRADAAAISASTSTGAPIRCRTRSAPEEVRDLRRLAATRGSPGLSHGRPRPASPGCRTCAACRGWRSMLGVAELVVVRHRAGAGVGSRMDRGAVRVGQRASPCGWR